VARDAAVTADAGLEAVLARIDQWGASHASAAVVDQTGVMATRGSLDHRYRWASVTKLLAATATLIAVERGMLALDEAAGPPDSTVRHLLAHTSGLAFDGDAILAKPGSRRIYSNPGFDVLGALIALFYGLLVSGLLERRFFAPRARSARR